MSKTKILSLISALLLLPLLFLTIPVNADRLDTSTWRADSIWKYVKTPPSGPGGYPIYGYKYDGSIKGLVNSISIDDVAFTYVTLWDVFDELETPVYFEDFYTYTVSFRISSEDGVVYFEDINNHLNEMDIMIGSSDSKFEMYGTNDPDDIPPENDALPLHATKGGYFVYLKDFFDNIAVGSSLIDDNTIEVSVVFSTPARTLEYHWDTLCIEVQDLVYEWDEETDSYEEFLYFTNLDVMYDKDLSAYESAVQEGLTEIGGKVDDLNNTIQQGNQQAHQDAEDIKDAINNQANNEKNEASSGGNANVAALQSSMGDFDLTTYGDAINTLMGSLNYDGTDTTWTLPSSGKVPYFNATLWEEQEVDLCPDYIVNLESFNLITVFTNFVVAIGCVYVVVNIFNDLLTTMNGAKGDDTKYTEG